MKMTTANKLVVTVAAVVAATGLAMADAAAVVAERTADEKARGAGKRGWIAYEAERNQYFPAQNLARVKEIAAMLPARAELPGAPWRYRAEWDALAKTKDGKDRIEAARKALAEPIEPLTIAAFEAYGKTGDRSVYAKPLERRQKQLTALVWGECLENRGAFAAKIAEVLEAVCDEPSWVAPFEGGISDARKPLHGVPHYIDLTASARASTLATSLSWLGDRLPAKTRERVLDTLRGRVFETFLLDARRKGERTPYHNWWMPDRFNWSAVCHDGCVTAILAVEDDPTVRAEAIEASERLMAPCFLDGFLADGYCEEGMGYWNYGFGNFLRLAATVKVQTDGGVDFCKAFPRAKLVAGFGAKYRMGHGSSPLFADGNGTAAKDVLSLINMNWPEMYRAEVQDLPVFANGDMTVFAVRNFGRFKFVAPPREKLAPLPLRDWFENAETLICRKDGLAFAIKGGWNGDRHNHNDAGSYLIDIDDREVTGDPGNENYTGRTFSRRRYESKVLNSYAHPVPCVGGELQGTGPAFGAKVLKTDFTEDRDTIVYDLAPAYPAKVPIVKLVRTAVFDRKAGEITVADEVEFAEPTAFETPVIAWNKPIPGKDRGHFRLGNGKGRELEVSIGVRGGDWELTDEFIENPGRTQPHRLAIALREPVLKATIGVRYRLAPVPATKVAEPLKIPEGATCLCALDLVGAECGAGRTPKKGRNCEGKTLSIAGRTFEKGVGVHAPFSWKLLANGALERFTATVGVDDDVKEAKMASVVFKVEADGKTVADTGVLRSGDRAVIDADLRGAKWVTLRVTDAGDGFACDHADWADAAFVSLPGKKWGEEALRELSPQMGVLTPPVRPEPRINGARLFGVRPGHPVLWRIPVSGERPMSVEVRGLPEGVVYDPTTCSLAGATAARGDHDFLVTAKNAKGVATRKLTLRVGDTLCLTPPMGWNSWNCWGQEVSDARMRQAADAMVETGLAEHGWNYIVVDDCWRTRPTEKEAGFKRPDWIGVKAHMYGPARLPDGTPATNAQFPDMKAMADYIHSKGLRAGLYSVPAEVACCYTFGSWQHEAKDAETWAKWGYDLVKYDWCYGDRQYGVEGGSKRDWQFKAYKLMGDLLAKQPRDIVYNVCNYGLFDVTEWARAAGGHYWRTNDDVKDSWKLLITSVDWNMKVAYAAGPGGWNDPDMLVIGPMRSNGFTKSRLTPNEQYTHMSLWAIQSAPLFIGCDMAQLAKDPLAWSFLTNDEVIDIDQDELGKVGKPVAHTDAFDVWARPLANGDWAVALFNRTWEPLRITAKFADFGAAGTLKVRDVWAQKDVGSYADDFTAEVYGHATRLFRLSRPDSGSRGGDCPKCD